MGCSPSVDDTANDQAKAQHGAKTVYLIRHGESLGNVLSDGVKRCACSRLAPLFCEPECCSILCDPVLSSRGEEQVAEIAEQLIADDFVRVAGIQMIVHSELWRAKLTCEGLFATSGLEFHELEMLNEWHYTDTDCHCTPGTYCSRAFAARVQAVRNWLASRAEHVICFVGHGAHFECLQSGSGASHMSNVEVRRCTFDVASRTFDAGDTLYCPSASGSDIDLSD
eukprot:gnl/TRDRNA2_/TRDRNA2_170118_c0_seq2.p1 gnl/TRDRNA2_/TRDRNA2_170118_c0~~gnl/TRDRNA2_/TRDRNA2_170118_c0_seq2.p1  ORF type:complete len:225 (+),score=23.13 gnl/TRDRNA2_/TRDRNA2_170118_c0_seq2:114-788(+)